MDLLLSRYHDMGFILDLPLGQFIDLCRTAREKQAETRWFLQWVVQLPLMTKDTFVSFDQYTRRLTGADIDTRPVDEILREIDQAFEDQRRGGDADGNGDI